MFGKRKWIFIITVVLVVCAALLCAIFLASEEWANGADQPTLVVNTPQKIDPATIDPFVVDVTISSLGEAVYPAMSMSISFDADRLEFLGIEEGNVRILDENGQPALPEWIYNTASCNQSGCINVMYLDMTGGQHAFSKELLAEEGNVVLRLRFRLKEGVGAGDVMDLIVEDAVFAASDEKDSLAMTLDTLKVRNGKIVIGE